MTSKKVLFIVNPISGGRSKKGIQEVIIKEMKASAIEFKIVFTESTGHASLLVNEYKSSYDVFVAVGGDGTINEVAKEIKGSDKVLAVIPLGSGNGLARFLEIPLNPKKAIKALLSSKLKSIDSASLNGNFFVSIAGLGFDSLIAGKFENTKGRGFLNYAHLSLKEYFNYSEKKYTMFFEGKKETRSAFMISFANSDQFGYNTRIAPLSDICDGLLEVCIIRKPSLIQVPLLLWQMWTRKADRSKLIERIKTNEIRLSQSEIKFANIDGESIEVKNEIEVILSPGNLKVLVPNKDKSTRYFN